jgi:uncharacterized protein (DUF4213/DUF364 family)
MDKTSQQKIIDFLQPFSKDLQVADVRVGLGYTSVRLDNGNLGLAWTAASSLDSCTHVAKAGTLAGRPVVELLAMLGGRRNLLAGSDNPLERSIGLAAANAVAAGLPRPESTKEEVLDIVNVQASDHVVMVGFFGPLMPGLKKTGCKLDILELREDRPGTISPLVGKEPLSACTVAIITGTSIVTGTLDGLLADLGDPRAAVILGPSTFMRPEVFIGTPITHLAGAWVRNPAAVEKIVSEGGGTMILRQHMDFEIVCVRKST